ncbi:hypothetical protein [Ramlibacter sp. AN1133]|uniref:hypothetical protein n=1 Tax=Ramlibacter sp. AN1133 TaxID=3133429 RepID=UPI0030C562F5
MSPEQEKLVLASLYDRLHDAVTYSPEGKAPAFSPQNIYFQMTKNTVLRPSDFADMLSPANPNGNQLTAELYSAMVDKLPSPGPLWADSTDKLSDEYANLAAANTDSKPTPDQQKLYDDAFNFLVTEVEGKDFRGNVTRTYNPSPIALAYEQAKAAYISAVSGYRTAYNGYDLTKKEDQRAWNAAAPMLQNLVDQTWNAWGRAGKTEVEEAQAALNSTIGDAVRLAIDQIAKSTSAEHKLPSSTPGGFAWLPSYGVPTEWASDDLHGPKLEFTSAYLNKTTSSQADSYGAQAGGSFGLFHASGGVEGEHKSSSSHMDAQNLKLEAELIAVSIVRPWFSPLLLGMNGWWINSARKGELSNGDPKNPAGTLALIPTGFVLAKNVKITADFSSEDKKFISNSIATKAEAGWGPFSFSGKYAHSDSKEDFNSKFDGGSLVFPGLQLIAWINTVPRLSPPRDPK